MLMVIDRVYYQEGRKDVCEDDDRQGLPPISPFIGSDVRDGGDFEWDRNRMNGMRYELFDGV